MAENSKIDMNDPTAGSRWRHAKGGIYRVICRSRDADAPGTPRIITQSEETGRFYAWKEDEWFDRIPDPQRLHEWGANTQHAMVPQFTLVEYANASEADAP